MFIFNWQLFFCCIPAIRPLRLALTAWLPPPLLKGCGAQQASARATQTAHRGRRTAAAPVAATAQIPVAARPSPRRSVKNPDLPPAMSFVPGETRKAGDVEIRVAGRPSPSAIRRSGTDLDPAAQRKSLGTFEANGRLSPPLRPDDRDGRIGIDGAAVPTARPSHFSVQSRSRPAAASGRKCRLHGNTNAPGPSGTRAALVGMTCPADDTARPSQCDRQPSRHQPARGRHPALGARMRRGSRF